MAKAIHPDLSTNEEEKKWRQRLMAEANSAYARKDRKSLRAILHQWQNAPEYRTSRDLSDRELLHIQGLVGLRELYLTGNGITDSGLGFLQRLQRLQNLHRLYLYDTYVTDHGAEALSRLRGLRCITFCGPRITETAMHTFQASLPGCRITILNHNTDRGSKRAPR